MTITRRIDAYNLIIKSDNYVIVVCPRSKILMGKNTEEFANYIGKYWYNLCDLPHDYLNKMSILITTVELLPDTLLDIICDLSKMTAKKDLATNEILLDKYVASFLNLRAFV